MDVREFVNGKSAIVTGGGGSIGSEICRRLWYLGIERLLIIENSEIALYKILEELECMESRVEGRLVDVRDAHRINKLFYDFKPFLVFHAAALKHVPYLEQDWQEAVKTNILGTVNVASAAMDADASVMVNISTDKAVQPVSILGKTKAIAETYVRALDDEIAGNQRFISVRFGNVKESSGSVIPKFKKQIEQGGPVTVTHPEMTRYMISVEQAVDLVVKAACYAHKHARDNSLSTFALEMGEPVKIKELAEEMVGGTDTKIVFTGKRPGERLHEILFHSDEVQWNTEVEGLIGSDYKHPGLLKIQKLVNNLEETLACDELPWQLSTQQ